MNNFDERRNRGIGCAHDLSTTISKIYFIFGEEEAPLILLQKPNLPIRELQDECWRRWEIMCGNDEPRFNRILEVVRRYEDQYENQHLVIQ